MRRSYREIRMRVRCAAVILGVFMLSAGLAGLNSKLGLQADSWFWIAFLILSGFLCLLIALTHNMLMSFCFSNINKRCKAIPGLRGTTSSKSVIDSKILVKGPKIVVIGGGTGLSVLLRGLKGFTSNITAVVTVADDGGGSGMIRSELGMLPPGDIRNCILALADTEPVMEELLQYRFNAGHLKGQSFGNLLIAAMNGISDNFEEAVRKISQVLAVTGQVLPVTLEDITLYGQLKNGRIVKGESSIPEWVKSEGSPIQKVYIQPYNPEPLAEVVEAIKYADAVVLGPGSLYTSIIPNLLVKDIVKSIDDSDALKIYVANIMTQPGETDDFSVSDHVRALEEHAGKNIINYVIANTGKIEPTFMGRYVQDGAVQVKMDNDGIRPGIKVVSRHLATVDKGYIRHKPYELAQSIIKLAIKD